MSLSVIILAAGKGTRMKSPFPKVLHPLAGEPLVIHVLETAFSLKAEKILVVVGFKAHLLREILRPYAVDLVWQEEQLGTGDAVKRCEKALEGFQGKVLVLCGDVPLLKEETLRKLLEIHQEEKAAVTILTAKFPDPTGYGRIVREESGLVARIVEEKDANPEIARIKEINSGTYVFEKDFLFSALKEIRPENVQKEYYLTDVVEIAFRQGRRVAAYQVEDYEEVIGINSQEELARVEALYQERLRRKWLKAGVTMVRPESVYLERKVSLAPGVRLHPQVVLRGETKIDEEAEILSFCYLEDVTVGPKAILGPGLFLKGVRVAPGEKLGSKETFSWKIV